MTLKWDRKTMYKAEMDKDVLGKRITMYKSRKAWEAWCSWGTVQTHGGNGGWGWGNGRHYTYERVRCLACRAMLSLLWSVHSIHQKYLGGYVV